MLFYESMIASAFGLGFLGICIFYTNSSSGIIGFNIIFLMMFPLYASHLILKLMEVEIQMISVERMIKYTNLK